MSGKDIIDIDLNIIYRARRWLRSLVRMELPAFAALALIFVAGCSGTKPPSIGIIDLGIGAAGKLTCESIPAKDKALTTEVVKSLVALDDGKMYEAMSNRTGAFAVLLPGAYGVIWSLIHDKLDKGTADADSWTLAARRMWRDYLNGCASGLGLNPTNILGATLVCPVDSPKRIRLT